MKLIPLPLPTRLPQWGWGACSRTVWNRWVEEGHRHCPMGGGREPHHCRGFKRAANKPPPSNKPPLRLTSQTRFQKPWVVCKWGLVYPNVKNDPCSHPRGLCCNCLFFGRDESHTPPGGAYSSSSFIQSRVPPSGKDGVIDWDKVRVITVFPSGAPFFGNLGNLERSYALWTRAGTNLGNLQRKALPKIFQNKVPNF